MPVFKFKSVEHASELAWLRPDDPALLAAIRAVWRRGHFLAPWKLPPGVYRFRDMDEANAKRLEWERTCVEPRFKSRESDTGPRSAR